MAQDKGSCLCRKVTFTLDYGLKPLTVCHCTECRKHSGHHEVSADVPREKLVIQGKE